MVFRDDIVAHATRDTENIQLSHNDVLTKNIIGRAINEIWLNSGHIRVTKRSRNHGDTRSWVYSDLATKREDSSHNLGDFEEDWRRLLNDVSPGALEHGWLAQITNEYTVSCLKIGNVYLMTKKL